MTARTHHATPEWVHRWPQELQPLMSEMARRYGNTDRVQCRSCRAWFTHNWAAHEPFTPILCATCSAKPEGVLEAERKRAQFDANVSYCLAETRKRTPWEPVIEAVELGADVTPNGEACITDVGSHALLPHEQHDADTRLRSVVLPSAVRPDGLGDAPAASTSAGIPMASVPTPVRHRYDQDGQRYTRRDSVVSVIIVRVGARTRTIEKAQLYSLYWDAYVGGKLVAANCHTFRQAESMADDTIAALGAREGAAR